MATGIPSKKMERRHIVPVSLNYEGKRTPDSILTHGFIPMDRKFVVNEDGGNIFFFGDNLNALLYMLHTGYAGKIQLIYIDPPFATTSDFVNREQNHAYSDSLSGGEYIEFLRERLIVMRELLSDEGSIYLHLDGKMTFSMKMIMDEIFGEKNFRAFITRKKCSTKNYTKNTYGNISDYILFYSKTDRYIWNRPFEPWEYEKMIEQYPYVDNQGRRYKKVPVHAPGSRNGETGKQWRGKFPPKGKHWQYAPSKLDELDAAGEICWSKTGNPRRIVYCDESKGIPIQDIWLNYRDSINQRQKTTGYPTEKNYDMLRMIVSASSNPGGLVMDCFAGSGTTLEAAFELSRPWIGMDNSPESLKAIKKRFTTGLELYGDYIEGRKVIQTTLGNGAKCPFVIKTDKEHCTIVQEICAF